LQHRVPGLFTTLKIKFIRIYTLLSIASLMLLTNIFFT
jgi:hypothetical protein